MTDSASQPRRRLPRADRRRQLATAALKILAEEGAAKLTVRALGAEVGLSDGAIFRHFDSKEEIVDAAIERFEGFLVEDLPSPGGAPMSRLRAFFVRRLAKLRAHPEILKLTFSDRLEEAAGESGAARVRALVKSQRAFVMQTVRDAQAASELPADVAPEVLGWMVMGTMRGAAQARGRRAPAPQEVFDSIERALGL